jgi:hypothetical protein
MGNKLCRNYESNEDISDINMRFKKNERYLNKLKITIKRGHF